MSAPTIDPAAEKPSPSQPVVGAVSAMRMSSATTCECESWCGAVGGKKRGTERTAVRNGNGQLKDEETVLLGAAGVASQPGSQPRHFHIPARSRTVQ